MRQKSFWFLFLIPLLVWTDLAFAGEFDTNQLKIKIGQYLGKTLPNVVLTQADGKAMSLDQLRGKPVILSFIYYRCPNTCHFIGKGLAEGLKATNLKIGQDMHVLSVDFDTKENLADLNLYVNKLKLDLGSSAPAGMAKWQFTLSQKNSLEQLLKATGFKFFWSAESKSFIHPNVYIVLTPSLKISRYLFGLYPDGENIELAVKEAANEKISPYSWVNSALEWCLEYDHLNQKYRINIFNLLILIALGLAILTFLLIRLNIAFRKKYRKS